MWISREKYERLLEKHKKAEHWYVQLMRDCARLESDLRALRGTVDGLLMRPALPAQGQGITSLLQQAIEPQLSPEEQEALKAESEEWAKVGKAWAQLFGGEESDA